MITYKYNEMRQNKITYYGIIEHELDDISGSEETKKKIFLINFDGDLISNSRLPENLPTQIYYYEQNLEKVTDKNLLLTQLTKKGREFVTNLQKLHSKAAESTQLIHFEIPDGIDTFTGAGPAKLGQKPKNWNEVAHLDWVIEDGYAFLYRQTADGELVPCLVDEETTSEWTTSYDKNIINQCRMMFGGLSGDWDNLLTFEDVMDLWDERNFPYYDSWNDWGVDKTTVQTVTIPPSITSIGEYAFAGCSSLKNVEIPSSVIRIGKGAFGGCSSLATVTIPDSINSIEDSAFDGCYKCIVIIDAMKENGDYNFVDVKKTIWLKDNGSTAADIEREKNEREKIEIEKLALLKAKEEADAAADKAKEEADAAADKAKEELKNLKTQEIKRKEEADAAAAEAKEAKEALEKCKAERASHFCQDLTAAPEANPTQLGSAHNGSFSSAQIRDSSIPTAMSKTGVKVYEDDNFEGDITEFSFGDYTMDDIIAKGGTNDNISSIKVMNGFEAILYEHADMSGWEAHFSAGEYTLGDIIAKGGENDGTSSISVRFESKEYTIPTERTYVHHGTVSITKYKTYTPNVVARNKWYTAADIVIRNLNETRMDGVKTIFKRGTKILVPYSQQEINDNKEKARQDLNKIKGDQLRLEQDEKARTKAAEEAEKIRLAAEHKAEDDKKRKEGEMLSALTAKQLERIQSLADKTQRKKNTYIGYPKAFCAPHDGDNENADGNIGKMKKMTLNKAVRLCNNNDKCKGITEKQWANPHIQKSYGTINYLLKDEAYQQQVPVGWGDDHIYACYIKEP
jgi:hypothetical protein